MEIDMYADHLKDGTFLQCNQRSKLLAENDLRDKRYYSGNGQDIITAEI